MAMPSPSISGAALNLPARPGAALRAERLAEMVAGLTGCEAAGALRAVRSHLVGGHDGQAAATLESLDPLEIVARAILTVAPDPVEPRADDVVVDLRGTPPVVSINLTDLDEVDLRHRL